MCSAWDTESSGYLSKNDSVLELLGTPFAAAWLVVMLRMEESLHGSHCDVLTYSLCKALLWGSQKWLWPQSASSFLLQCKCEDCFCRCISNLQAANTTYLATDRINRRDEGLITISDSSDEELPLQETPAEQQHEDDDDEDVVILAEVIFHFCICCCFIRSLYNQLMYRYPMCSWGSPA